MTQRLTGPNPEDKTGSQKPRRDFQRHARVAQLVVLLWMTATVEALACPDDQYEQCGPFGVCVCLPKWGGDVGREVERLKNEANGQTGGPALELWLVQSRNSAIGTSQPIPPQIRRALTGYVEEDLMNRVRFKIGDNGILNLAGLTIAFGDALGGSVAAVALVDLIVFRSADDAFNNPALWAHELTHIKQFRDWGTRDFAISYARNANSVEDPAYEVGNGYDAWVSQNRFPPPPVSGPTPGPSYPVPGPRWVACVTSAGVSAPFLGQPGAPCFMQTPWGLVNGFSR